LVFVVSEIGFVVFLSYQPFHPVSESGWSLWHLSPTPTPHTSLFPLPARSVAAIFNPHWHCAWIVSHLLSLHDRTLGVALFRLTSFLAFLDLSDHAFESFSDILVVTCACFGEAAAQFFGEFLAIGEGDLALFGTQIGLVADNCEGDGIGALRESVVSSGSWILLGKGQGCEYIIALSLTAARRAGA
jgi:hypothetical protein